MDSLQKKIVYIWDYYKVAIIGVPLGILFLIYVFSAFTGSKDVPFSVYIINQDVTIESCADLEKDLLQTIPSLKNSGGAYVNHSLIINPSAPDIENQMSFTTAIAGHTIDIMISDHNFVEHYAKMEAFANLQEILPAKLYEELSPYILTFENKEGIAIPYALDVASSPFLSIVDTLDAPLLTIAKYSEHQVICAEWLSILFLQ